MVKYWIVAGLLENWQLAFEHGRIWGLRPRLQDRWERIQEGDKILIYVMKPVGGIVGYGTIRRKFKQDKPLWPDEIKRNEVIWPYRFDFDVDYLLPQDRWDKDRVVTKHIRLMAPIAPQVIKDDEAANVIRLLKPTKPARSKKGAVAYHDVIKNMLVEIGKMQGYIAESEYSMDGARIDVVWRRVERSVPAYVFEVQIGGDLYHALARLKHARDIWNSKIFLVAGSEDMAKADELLKGAFHEIESEIKLVDSKLVEKLHKMKKDYKEFESSLGL